MAISEELMANRETKGKEVRKRNHNQIMVTHTN